MDLRVKKTLISIEEAFYSLRKRKSLEKITVKELSETAMINKATFYLHYKDIFDLSEKLQENLVTKIIEESLKGGLKKERESYELFTKNLINSVTKKTEEITTIFPKNSNEFINRLEKKLKSVIFTLIPEYKNDTKIDIMLSYMIYGSYYASLGSYNCTNSQITSCLTAFSSKLLQD